MSQFADARDQLELLTDEGGQPGLVRELRDESAAALELGLQQIHRDVCPREQLAGRLLAFLEKAEEDVLGLDRLAAVLTREPDLDELPDLSDLEKELKK